LNFRPWGYEPHGLTWLPYPAPQPKPPYSTLINSSNSPKNKKAPTTKDTKKIALERINILFEQADKTYRTDQKRAQRYADLARRIATRNRVHLPPDLRRRICRSCKTYLNPLNSTTRIRQKREPHIATTCKNCGHINRHPLRRKERRP
jgi:ribonuclease P protein subunit RPR2